MLAASPEEASVSTGVPCCCVLVALVARSLLGSVPVPVERSDLGPLLAARSPEGGLAPEVVLADSVREVLGLRSPSPRSDAQDVVLRHLVGLSIKPEIA